MIQIDLPMPESCDVCQLNYDFCWCKGFKNRNDWEKYRDNWNNQVCDGKHRPKYCPLEECKEGHWIEKEDYNLDTYYDCSVCGESWTTIDGTPWQNGMNYCPNCGAKMVHP